MLQPSKKTIARLATIVFFFLSPHLYAAEIISKPLKKYRIDRDTAPSIDELLSHYNNVKQQRYDECRSADYYTCWTSAPFSKGGAYGNHTVDGEPSSYIANGTSIREKKDHNRDYALPSFPSDANNRHFLLLSG
jgi:hypothetical protein